VWTGKNEIDADAAELLTRAGKTRRASTSAFKATSAYPSITKMAGASPIRYSAILRAALTYRRKGEPMQSTMSRRAFVTGLAMFSMPLIALAQDQDKEKKKEEKKKKAEDKKDEAKDKAEDAVDDKDKVVDGPGTDNSQDRRQDRRRDAAKK